MSHTHWNKYQNGCATDNVTVDRQRHQNNKESNFLFPTGCVVKPQMMFSQSFYVKISLYRSVLAERLELILSEELFFCDFVQHGIVWQIYGFRHCIIYIYLI